MQLPTTTTHLQAHTGLFFPQWKKNEQLEINNKIVDPVAKCIYIHKKQIYNLPPFYRLNNMCRCTYLSIYVCMYKWIYVCQCKCLSLLRRYCFGIGSLTTSAIWHKCSYIHTYSYTAGWIDSYTKPNKANQDPLNRQKY